MTHSMADVKMTEPARIPLAEFVFDALKTRVSIGPSELGELLRGTTPSRHFQNLKRVRNAYEILAEDVLIKKSRRAMLVGDDD